jgi:hypothetical protein
MISHGEAPLLGRQTANTVAKQTRELIASQEALARENIRAMESGFGRVAQATEEGFEQLTWEMLAAGPIRPLNPSDTKPTVGFRIARSIGS